mmetsp:Transcript_26088/g.67431  ORF Transcript_26088/g.67431 Transcript_26088/m.67431 type:complete len:280 (-) Transcript_26088:70-909(-)
MVRQHTVALASVSLCGVASCPCRYGHPQRVPYGPANPRAHSHMPPLSTPPTGSPSPGTSGWEVLPPGGSASCMGAMGACSGTAAPLAPPSVCGTASGPPRRSRSCCWMPSMSATYLAIVTMFSSMASFRSRSGPSLASASFISVLLRRRWRTAFSSLLSSSCSTSTLSIPAPPSERRSLGLGAIAASLVLSPFLTIGCRRGCRALCALWSELRELCSVREVFGSSKYISPLDHSATRSSVLPAVGGRVVLRPCKSSEPETARYAPFDVSDGPSKRLLTL